jgi:hypothetical protein
MSLRTKQALILLLATVLPFAIGGAAMDLVVAPAYRKAVAQASREATQRVADHLAWDLARDVQRLQRLAGSPQVHRLAAVSPLTPDQAAARERRWPNLRAGTPEVDAVVLNPVSETLRWWQQTEASTAELILTNSAGQVVASSTRPARFGQGETPWWKRSFAGGKGSSFVSNVQRDPTTGSWGMTVALPVRATRDSPVVGVLKAHMDVARAFEDVTRSTVGTGGRARLVDSRGRIVIAPDRRTPLATSLSSLDVPRLRSAKSGVVTTRGSDGELISWSRVPLAGQDSLGGARTPILYVVTSQAAEQAYGTLRNVQRWMLLISVATILLSVGAGYWLAEILVVRQVRELARGMRRLARGDFEGAHAVAERLVKTSGGLPWKRRGIG